MDSIIRGLTVYIFLLIVFRIAGKRTLSQSTTFDLVLLLIISETTQQAMVANDNSVTNAALLILTLVGASIFLSVMKRRFPKLDRLMEGSPLIVVEHGKMLEHRMDKARVSKEDILFAARAAQGLERLDQVKFAVVEVNGEITIVPEKSK